MIPYGDRVFMVERGNAHVFLMAYSREDAKRAGARYMGGDPDAFTVTPLTEPGDRIRFEISVSV